MVATLEVIAGLVLCLIIFYDLFQSVVLPRPAVNKFALVRFVLRRIWVGWRWRALEWVYGRVSPGGYADEHITHYGRENLAAYLQARGMTVESVDYVGGSEMIFSLRKSTSRERAVPGLPVTAGLRNAHSGTALRPGS